MRQVEYSIWSLFDAIWSTPYGHYLLPYGVLHMVTVEFTFSRESISVVQLVVQPEILLQLSMLLIGHPQVAKK